MNKSFDYQNIINILRNESSNETIEEVLTWLKNNDFEDEELQNLKFYLEQNNWQVTDLKNRFQNIENRLKSSSTFKKKNNYLSVAAILILSFFFGYYFLIQKTTSIDSFFIEEPGLPIYMNNNFTNNLEWNEIMDLYKDNNINKANIKLNKLGLLKESNNDTVLYFKGVFSYKLERFEDATNYFDKVSKSESSFREAAQFRKAFALYKSKKSIESELVFENIKISNSVYSEDSKKILQSFFNKK